MEGFSEDTKNFEKLFLFEFFVDHVGVYSSKLNLDKQTIAILGPLAIRFQFLDYPPIEVCEESFAASTKPLEENKNIILKSGKSCVFSLSTLKSKKVLSQNNLDVYLTVYKYKLQRYKPGAPPERPEDVFIGRTMMDIADIFKELYNSPNNEKLTRTKTSMNRLVDVDGNLVGKILFMIRISCFGFMVMTAFELPEQEQQDFKYKNIEYDKVSQTEPMRMSASEGERKSDSRPCGQPCSQEVPKEKEKEKDKDNDDKDKDKDKEKKKKKKKKDKKKKEAEKKPSSETCPFSYQVCPCPCRMNQQSNFQGSQYPESTGQPMGAASTPCMGQQNAQSISGAQPPGPNRARDMDIDPGAVGIRGNQLVFKMPEKQAPPTVPVEGKFASSVYYKMEDESKNGARNVIQILPKNPNCEVDQTKVDDKQDVLVLKLGKKRLSAGKKPKLELELRTPKMKEDKPVVDTKDTQYLESDIPKPPKGKKDKSVKGGKKKKK